MVSEGGLNRSMDISNVNKNAPHPHISVFVGAFINIPEDLAEPQLSQFALNLNSNPDMSPSSWTS